MNAFETWQNTLGYQALTAFALDPDSPEQDLERRLEKAFNSGSHSSRSSPVNSDVTAALVEALRAIVDYYGYVGYFLTDKHIEDANTALHMAQFPDADENALRRKAWADRQEPVVPPFPSSISDPGVAICNKSLADSVLTVLVNVAGVMDGEIPKNIKQQVHLVIKAAILGTGEPAERPVVPVSEDVHLRLGPCRCHDCARARSEDVETIRKELQNDPLWMEFQTNALAALDRLAAAAGRTSGASRCAP